MKSFIIALGGICFLLIILNHFFPNTIIGSNDQINIFYTTLISALILSQISNYNFLAMIKYSVVFMLIIFSIFVIYVYKDDILNSKIMSNLIPAKPIQNDLGQIIVSSQESGHFQINVTMNNLASTCLIDTGATEILIDPRVAKDLGIDTNSLHYNIQSSTANGVGAASEYILDNFQVGTIILSKTRVLINQEPLGPCLLGMSFLKRLKNFEIKGNQLIMTP